MFSLGFTLSSIWNHRWVLPAAFCRFVPVYIFGRRCFVFCATSFELNTASAAAATTTVTRWRLTWHLHRQHPSIMVTNFERGKHIKTTTISTARMSSNSPCRVNTPSQYRTVNLGSSWTNHHQLHWSGLNNQWLMKWLLFSLLSFVISAAWETVRSWLFQVFFRFASSKNCNATTNINFFYLHNFIHFFQTPWLPQVGWFTTKLHVLFQKLFLPFNL